MTHEDWTGLSCPACGDEVRTIGPCEVAHLDCVADTPDALDFTWCEDRRGVCPCGARLYVDVDDGQAYLVEEEEDERRHDAAEIKLERVRILLSQNGCDCECGCDADGHSADCEPCLACRIGGEA